MNTTFSLKEFIEVTLSDICEAVDSVRTKHSYIAPKFFVDPSGFDKATVVDFDVAVTVSQANQVKDAKEGKVGGGLKVSVIRVDASIGANDEKTSASNVSKESRVKFSVPVFFQFDEEERKKHLKRIKKGSRVYDKANHRARGE